MPTTCFKHHLLLTASAFLCLIVVTVSFPPRAAFAGTRSASCAPSRSRPAALFSTLTNDDAAAAADDDRQRRLARGGNLLEDLPAPPCPRSNPSDDLFRTLRTAWPVKLQNSLRECGLLRLVEDALFLLVGVPQVLQKHPRAIAQFWELTKLTKRIRYGDHAMQYVEVIEPLLQGFAAADDDDEKSPKSDEGVVAFVHGGAWGSGQPWMYWLAALPFWETHQAVAVVGYRTYPDANVNGQVEDIGLGLKALARDRPDLLDEQGRVDSLACHSSGAHIGLLHVLEAAKASTVQTMGGQTKASEIEHTPIGRFVGISGVYCIPSHYEYEKGRGVDQLSSLRAANGPGRERFREASPAYRLECFVSANGEEECVLLDTDDTEDTENSGGAQVKLDDHVPDMLFIHGLDDNVVQYNQTNVVVDALRSSLGDPDRCEEVLLENVGHADTVMHLMFGGVTRDVVLGRRRQQRQSISR